MTKREKLLLKTASKLISRLMDKVEDLQQNAGDYYQSSTILASDKWLRYYYQEQESKEDEKSIIEDLKSYNP
jgi:hypothetical protein